MSDSMHPRNVYIACLPASFTEQQLRALFTPFGAITSAKLVPDLRAGGYNSYGFVLMERGEAAKAAIDGLAELQHDGHRVQVRLARLTPGVSLEGEVQQPRSLLNRSSNNPSSVAAPLLPGPPFVPLPSSSAAAGTFNSNSDAFLHMLPAGAPMPPTFVTLSAHHLPLFHSQPAAAPPLTSHLLAQSQQQYAAVGGGGTPPNFAATLGTTTATGAGQQVLMTDGTTVYVTVTPSAPMPQGIAAKGSLLSFPPQPFHLQVPNSPAMTSSTPSNSFVASGGSVGSGIPGSPVLLDAASASPPPSTNFPFGAAPNTTAPLPVHHQSMGHPHVFHHQPCFAGSTPPPPSLPLPAFPLHFATTPLPQAPSAATVPPSRGTSQHQIVMVNPAGSSGTAFTTTGPSLIHRPPHAGFDCSPGSLGGSLNGAGVAAMMGPGNGNMEGTPSTSVSRASSFSFRSPPPLPGFSSSPILTSFTAGGTAAPPHAAQGGSFCHGAAGGSRITSLGSLGPSEGSTAMNGGLRHTLSSAGVLLMPQESNSLPNLFGLPAPSPPPTLGRVPSAGVIGSGVAPPGSASSAQPFMSSFTASGGGFVISSGDDGVLEPQPISFLASAPLAAASTSGVVPSASRTTTTTHQLHSAAGSGTAGFAPGMWTATLY